MLRLAGLKAGDVLYDLGCGDGRIVIAAAKRSGVRATGIDIDPVRIQESEANAAAAGLTGKVASSSRTSSRRTSRTPQSSPCIS